jgi:hypothetical protein
VPVDFIVVTASDVVRGAEDDFNRWYNEQHLPDFVACPGFLRASRYESVAGEPRFYAVYDIEGPEALETPELKRAWGWGPVAPSIRNSHGRVYRRTFTLANETTDGPPDFLLVVSSDVVPGMEAEFDEWYNAEHIPELLARPGFLAASRYECLDGEPAFLALYDLDRPDVRVDGFGPMTAHLRDFHGRVYRRIFTHAG